MDHDKSFCCFTGHRVIPSEERSDILLKLSKAIYDHIALGCRTFVAGGALGFDTYAAQMILTIREEKRHGVRLIVVAPFEGQADRWNASDKFRYENIRNGADDYICLSAGYHKVCMRIRNQHMVDLSAYCISYCTDMRSGTGQTVAYAQKKGLIVTNLATDFQQIIFK